VTPTCLYSELTVFSNFVQAILPVAISCFPFFSNYGVVGLVCLAFSEALSQGDGEFCGKGGQQDSRGGGVEAMNEMEGAITSGIVHPSIAFLLEIVVRAKECSGLLPVFAIRMRQNANRFIDGNEPGRVVVQNLGFSIKGEVLEVGERFRHL
jgi:hypothetical protein